MDSFRAYAFPLFMLFACFYFLNASGHTYSIDGMSNTYTAMALAERGSFAISPEYQDEIRVTSLRNDKGEVFSKYSPLTPILMVPFAKIGFWMGRSLSPVMPIDQSVFFVCGFLSPLLTALTVVALFGLCLSLGIKNHWALTTAILYALCTICLPYAKMSFPEPAAALLFTACLWFVFEYRRRGQQRWILLAGLAAALVPLARLSAVIGFIPILIYLAAGPRAIKGTMGLLIGIGAGLLMHAAFNFIRFHSLLETGYAGEIHQFTTPILAGLYGFLFSSDKSIVVYSPLLALLPLGLYTGWRKGAGAEMACIAGCYLVYLAFYSGFHLWAGGHSWGPRFFVTLVPCGMAAVGFVIQTLWNRRVWKVLIISLAMAGAAIQFSATSSKYNSNYEGAISVDNMERAYAQGRLFVPGPPRFLTLRVQFDSTFRHYLFFLGHADEYLKLQDLNYQKLVDNKLLENAPDFWFVLTWISSGWRVRLATLAIVILILVIGGISIKTLLRRHRKLSGI